MNRVRGAIALNRVCGAIDIVAIVLKRLTVLQLWGNSFDQTLWGFEQTYSSGTMVLTVAGQ